MSNDDNMSVDETMWEDVAPEIGPKGIPWKYTDKDDEIIGTYICKYESFNMYHKYVYVIQDLNNEERYFYGSPELDKLFERVKENDFIKIIFICRHPGVHGISFKLFKRRG